MFTGRRVDILDNGSLKIQYNRNRYYDYYTGRFLQTDPIHYLGGLNLYTYCGNNPLNWIDPYGLCEEGSDSIPWNILIGGSGTAGAVLGVTGGAQYVFNLGGEDGLYLHGGGGPYIGVSASGTVDFSVMHGQPSDLSGGSATYGGSGTILGVTVGGEGHLGEARGGTVSVGFGKGTPEGHIFIEGSKFIYLSEIIPTIRRNIPRNRLINELLDSYGE